MDELPYAAEIDPLELRLINDSDDDQREENPTAAKSCVNAIAGPRSDAAGLGAIPAAALDARR
jgi:hypothetical protein